jgi:hypothetical protein
MFDLEVTELTTLESQKGMCKKEKKKNMKEFPSTELLYFLY